MNQNIQVWNLLQQLPSWWVSRTLQSSCCISCLADFSFHSARWHVLSPAAGNQSWEHIFFSHVFFSSPDHHILKKVHQILPSFPHNMFTILFFSDFIGYLPNHPYPIQFQFCQTHFTASVFNFRFSIPFFLLLLVATSLFCFFFLCHTSLKRKYRSSVYQFLSGGDFIGPFPIPIKLILFLSRFWFC